jgi:alpha-glucosidase
MGEGKAKGDVYEDDEEGFSFQKGEFLHTHYEAELIPAHTGITEGGGEVVLKVASADGKWKKRNRSLIVRLLVGDVAEVCTVNVTFNLFCYCQDFSAIS